MVFAPFGILAVTALLTYLTAPEPWSIRQGLNQAAAQVDLAVPIYAALAALAERGIAMIFWALEQRKKWREERLEALAARDAAVREQVRDEVITEVRDEVVRDMEARLEQWARERGISPEDLPRLP